MSKCCMCNRPAPEFGPELTGWECFDGEYWCPRCQDGADRLIAEVFGPDLEAA